MDLITIRRGPTLVPATAFDLERLESVRTKRPLRTTVVFDRSAAHMRWWRALLAIVADAIGVSPGLLHAEIKWKAGLVRNIIMSKSAGPLVELESCAFPSMDEARFTEFTDIGVELLFRDYLPAVRRKDVFAEVGKMVGPRPR